MLGAASYFPLPALGPSTTTRGVRGPPQQRGRPPAGHPARAAHEFLPTRRRGRAVHRGLRVPARLDLRHRAVAAHLLGLPRSVKSWPGRCSPTVARPSPSAGTTSPTTSPVSHSRVSPSPSPARLTGVDPRSSDESPVPAHSPPGARDLAGVRPERPRGGSDGRLATCRDRPRGLPLRDPDHVAATYFGPGRPRRRWYSSVLDIALRVWAAHRAGARPCARGGGRVRRERWTPARPRAARRWPASTPPTSPTATSRPSSRCSRGVTTISSSPTSTAPCSPGPTPPPSSTRPGDGCVPTSSPPSTSPSSSSCRSRSASPSCSPATCARRCSTWRRSRSTGCLARQLLLLPSLGPI